MESHKDILAALTGIEEVHGEFPWGLVSLTDNISNPPTYVVFHTLCTLAGFLWHAFPEKSVWQVHVRYRDQLFSIEDWKGGAWFVRGMEDSPHCRQLAQEISRKIAAASRFGERELEPHFAAEVARGDFFVINSYFRVRPLYEHFQKEVADLIKERDETIRSWEEARKSQQPQEKDDSQKSRITFSQIGKELNYLLEWERRLSHSAISMIVFYFSYTEIIFDIIFALNEKRISSWTDFRKLRWDKRFKEVLPVAMDTELHDIYQKLLELKRTLRDPVVHGYGCEEALLIPMTYFGLIPVSYEPYAERFRLPWITAEEKLVSRAKDIFDQFDRWLDCDDKAQFAILYAKSGFPIPFQEKRLGEIRSWMSSRERFEQELIDEADIQDGIQDQYPYRP
jgi:hypothetical protein